MRFIHARVQGHTHTHPHTHTNTHARTEVNPSRDTRRRHQAAPTSLGKGAGGRGAGEKKSKISRNTTSGETRCGTGARTAALRTRSTVANKPSNAERLRRTTSTPVKQTRAGGTRVEGGEYLKRWGRFLFGGEMREASTPGTRTLTEGRQRREELTHKHTAHRRANNRGFYRHGEGSTPQR